MKSVIPYIISVTLYFFFAADLSGSDSRILSVGAAAGYSSIAGDYSAEIHGSWFAAVHVIPYSISWFYIDTEFSASVFTLAVSESSLLHMYRISLGPGVSFPVLSFLHIFISIDFLSVIVHFNAVQLQTNMTGYKPGLAVKGGLFFPVYEGLGFRLTAELSYFDLTGKAFLNMNFSGGISYDFNFLPREKKKKEKLIQFKKQKTENERKLLLYTLSVSADEEFSKKSIIKADELYKKIIILDPANKKAQERIKEIFEKSEILARAQQQEREKNYFKAIELYKSLNNFFPEIDVSLKRLRAGIFPQIKVLEKKAITAYTVKDYRMCIDILNRLLLIDPENETAKIYLPRAQKRYNIIKQLH